MAVAASLCVLTFAGVRLLAPLPSSQSDMPSLTALAPAEIAGAVQGMGLPPADQQRLLADIRADHVMLMQLSPMRSDQGDGDAVSVWSGGVSQFVVLSARPVPIALPKPADGMIRITGEVDIRHHGIQMSFLHRGHRLPLPLISVGQTIAVPVSLPAP